MLSVVAVQQTRKKSHLWIALSIEQRAASAKMDTLNLQSASEYLNNLLLARGLLRNGKRIDFADPGNAADGVEDTMAQIINLIHDLVTRRDVSATIFPVPTGYDTATVALTLPVRQREAEQRESLATTVKNLRKTEAKQALQVVSFGHPRFHCQQVERFDRP